MYVYLPVAEVSIDLFALLLLGGAVGLLSGLFGIGGGFLLTPLLIFLGIPPPVAVASGANQVVGASMSGLVAHWRRRNVDWRMGVVLMVGGLAGSGLGVALFAWLNATGRLDVAISLAYVVFLGTVGSLMTAESLVTMRRKRLVVPSPRKRHRHPFPGLPLKMRFPRSGLYISVLVPLAVGGFGGLLSAMMGVGGGFVMVPLMIYVIEMPTAVVVGTSLFQIVVVTANVTLLHAATTQTVDAVLMLTLLAGGVFGAQYGARLALRLKAEHLRLLLALMVLAVAVRLAAGLVVQPAEPYSIAPVGP